jgi:hypothetical protein
MKTLPGDQGFSNILEVVTCDVLHSALVMFPAGAVDFLGMGS